MSRTATITLPVSPALTCTWAVRSPCCMACTTARTSLGSAPSSRPMLRDTMAVAATLIRTASKVMASITPVNWLASRLAASLFCMMRVSS
ncbi:hypothetical protein D3C71_1901910 [compost metagenome]